MNKDPESDYLPHCIHCDGRHLEKELCVTNYHILADGSHTDEPRNRGFGCQSVIYKRRNLKCPTK